jgi:molybdenum cofactor guanylyltransferase
MIPGVVLAGGRSQRLGGGDKCLLALGGGTILEYVMGAVGAQVSVLAINSNSTPALFAHTGLDVLGDVLPGRLGPLAGIHTAMLWAREMGAEAVLTVPADTPFLPRDLVARLDAGRAGTEASVAVSGNELHPVVGIWPNALAEPLEAFLAEGVYRVRAWLGRISFRAVAFTMEQNDPFWNINTPEDLARARAAVA